MGWNVIFINLTVLFFFNFFLIFGMGLKVVFFCLCFFFILYRNIIFWVSVGSLYNVVLFLSNYSWKSVSYCFFKVMVNFFLVFIDR